MKKNVFIALIGIGSLIGLIFVQLNLLKVGIILEKERFDQKMKTVLNNVSIQIDRHDVLQDQLIYLYQTDSIAFKTEDWRSVDQMRDTIELMLKANLERKAVQIGYSYAVIDDSNNLPLLTSKNYFKENFDYEKYRRPLAGQLSIDCRCRVSLHFHADNLFNYLLSQLAYMIIPSALFVLLLLMALIFLIYNLNQQRKLASLKNDFINNLTHELKTPVFSISLLTKVMRASVKEGKYNKILEHIGLVEKESKLIKGHVEKVLELASLESGRYNLKRESKNAHQILEEVTNHFINKLKASRGRLSKRFEATQAQIEVDVVHFKNAIQNVLENALKYNNNPPRINIETRNEGKHFILTISDNGIGIATENQKYIFDKFYRVHQGDQHQVKGFGLGLSYVRQIIEAHKGNIKVKSQLGNGADFIITLPFI